MGGRRAVAGRLGFGFGAWVLVVGLMVGGCASRYDELRSRSREVKRELEAERDGVLGAPRSAEGAAKLDHLSSLRMTLSAVNVGLSAARYGLGADRRPVAYDVIGEAYDTIEWNIPLMPGDAGLRAMPAAFRGGRFDERLLPAAE